MIFDSKLTFIPMQTPLSLVGAIGATFQSQIIDVLGMGAGVAPPAIIGNQLNALFGQDSGIAQQPMLINMPITTSFASANGCGLNVEFQGAPDTGSAGGYQPGAWTTFRETGTMLLATLLAGEVIRLTWPEAWPASNLPRFLRLSFVPTATENFTDGVIGSALVVTGRDDWSIKYAKKNYSV